MYNGLKADVVIVDEVQTPHELKRELARERKAASKAKTQDFKQKRANKRSQCY